MEGTQRMFLIFIVLLATGTRAGRVPYRGSLGWATVGGFKKHTLESDKFLGVFRGARGRKLKWTNPPEPGWAAGSSQELLI